MPLGVIASAPHGGLGFDDVTVHFEAITEGTKLVELLRQ